MKVLFSEKQKISLWWLWLMLWSVTLIPIYGIYKQIIVGVPFGNKPMPNIGLVLMMVFMFIMLVLFWKIRLKTVITREAIFIHFSPFFKTKFYWSDIKSSKIVDYGFVGYGIRKGTKHGTIYTTGGKKGLAIKLLNGKKYCIGTQMEGDLKVIIDQMDL